jgi:2-dehydro-3-deoxyphosphogluconate aldolase/(4S)-4-hydroxy-2-oxoglutarate aldolase
MPTGGVSPTVENLKAWFQAGVTCVGIGSKLLPKEVLIEKNFTLISEKCREILQTIREIRTH